MLSRLHHMSSQLVIVFVGSVAIILMVYSKQTLFIWSNNLVLANSISPLLVILTAAALANSIGYIGHNLQIVYGKPNVIISVNLISISLAIVVLPFMIKIYGLNGCVYTWFFISILQALILLVSAHRSRLCELGIQWVLFDVLLPLSGSITPAVFFEKYIL